MNRIGNRVLQAQTSPQISSNMLIEMNDDECEALGCTKPVQSSTAMDAPSYEHEQECHDFLCFHVQMCSIMLHDDELSKEKCSCMKKFGKSLRENFWRILILDLKLMILIKTVRIKYLYLMLIMFNNNLSQMQV